MSLLCPHCESPVDHRPRYCPNCGSSLWRRCWNCDNDSFGVDKYCDECGAHFAMMENAVRSAIEAEELLIAGEWTEAGQRVEALRCREEGQYLDLKKWDATVEDLAYFRRTKAELLELSLFGRSGFRRLDDFWERADGFVRRFPVQGAPLLEDVQRDADEIRSRRLAAGAQWLDVLRSNFEFWDAIRFLDEGPVALRPDADGSALARERQAHAAVAAYLAGGKLDPTTGFDLGIGDVRQMFNQLPPGEKLEVMKAAVEREWTARRRKALTRLIIVGTLLILAAVFILVWNSRWV
jgi:hypothetical protein